MASTQSFQTATERSFVESISEVSESAGDAAAAGSSTAGMTPSARHGGDGLHIYLPRDLDMQRLPLPEVKPVIMRQSRFPDVDYAHRPHNEILAVLIERYRDGDEFGAKVHGHVPKVAGYILAKSTAAGAAVTLGIPAAVLTAWLRGSASLRRLPKRKDWQKDHANELGKIAVDFELLVQGSPSELRAIDNRIKKRVEPGLRYANTKYLLEVQQQFLTALCRLSAGQPRPGHVAHKIDDVEILYKQALSQFNENLRAEEVAAAADDSAAHVDAAAQATSFIRDIGKSAIEAVDTVAIVAANLATVTAFPVIVASVGAVIAVTAGLDALVRKQERITRRERKAACEWMGDLVKGVKMLEGDDALGIVFLWGLQMTQNINAIAQDPRLAASFMNVSRLMVKTVIDDLETRNVSA